MSSSSNRKRAYNKENELDSCELQSPERKRLKKLSDNSNCNSNSKSNSTTKNSKEKAKKEKSKLNSNADIKIFDNDLDNQQFLSIYNGLLSSSKSSPLLLNLYPNKIAIPKQIFEFIAIYATGNVESCDDCGETETFIMHSDDSKYYSNGEKPSQCVEKECKRPLTCCYDPIRCCVCSSKSCHDCNIFCCICEQNFCQGCTEPKRWCPKCYHCGGRMCTFCVDGDGCKGTSQRCHGYGCGKQFCYSCLFTQLKRVGYRYLCVSCRSKKN